MAIIREYHFGSQMGRVDDTYFNGVPEEELQRRRDKAQNIIGGMMYRQQLRELDQTENEGSAG